MVNYSSRIMGRRQVYFIRAKTMGHIKIGHTDDWRARLNGLQVGSPDELELLGFLLVEDAEAVERELHWKFSHLRVRGEWFRPARELLQFIADHAEHDEGPREERPYAEVFRLFGASPIEPLTMTNEMMVQWEAAEKQRAAERSRIPGGKVGALIEYKLARGITLKPREQAILDEWQAAHP